MLSTLTTVEQINTWRAAKSETEKLEFKEAKNQFDFETLLKYCVALANERGGVLLLGIANRPPRPVVGTKAFPNVVKTTEEVFNKLRFRVDIEEVQHPDGRVLVFHIPSRPTGHPYQLDGSYYMRSGESLVAMTPDQIKQIVTEEGSGLRKAIVSIVVVLVLSVIGFLSFKYWDAAHEPRQRDVEVGPAESYPTTDNKPTAVVKHPEQEPNIGADDSPRKQNPGNTQAPERADISWNFETKEGQFAFLGIQSIPGVVSEPLVNCFQAHGKNNLDDPILHFSGFIRSDTTNETFPVFLARDNQLLRPEDTLGIPRKAEFNLSAKPFPSNHPEGYLGAGMNASAFLKQYPELTFVFEYDGKRYVKHFTKQDIWTDVENFRRQSLGYDKP